MLPDHAATIARAFCGGSAVQDMVGVARGEQGHVWRLVTEEGAFAVKDLIVRQLPADAAADVAYQEAALATGALLIPRPVLTAAGEVLLDVAGHQVRVYAWVDLLPADTALEPALIGATIAAVHRIRHEPARPLHWWYTDPVGSERWAQLLEAAKAARAPFVEAFEAEIPHLLKLEALLETPRNLQNCHRDLWADNILPTPRRRRLCHRLGETAVSPTQRRRYPWCSLTSVSAIRSGLPSCIEAIWMREGRLESADSRRSPW